MATTSKQRLALAICDFLSTSVTDGTLPADDKDSIDVAIQCIADSFGVDPADKKSLTDAVGTQNLLQIYGVYEKLKNAPAPAPALAEPTEAQKKEADALKNRGNAAMVSNDYTSAIDLYTQALKLTPGNAVYLSNRAAAHSAAGDHQTASADAEAATNIDPKYTKAWSRLGLARYALNDHRGAMEAYQKGIDAEGNGGSDAMRRSFETAKRRVNELADEGAESTLAAEDAKSTRSRGAGAGAGAGNMADFMNNPMFNTMAQKLMSNPDLMNNLMSNPMLKQMAESFGSGGGGGMPDMRTLMQDPSIAEMARSIMGGGGAPDAPGAGRGSGAGPQ